MRVEKKRLPGKAVFFLSEVVWFFLAYGLLSSGIDLESKTLSGSEQRERCSVGKLSGKVVTGFLLAISKARNFTVLKQKHGCYPDDNSLLLALHITEG